MSFTDDNERITAQTQNVRPTVRVGHVGIGGHATGQTNRVLAQVLAGRGVVVAEAVVVEAGFRVLVLALVTEGAGGARAFERAHAAVAVELGLPGAPALPVDQLQGRAQVVGQDALALRAGQFGYRGKLLALFCWVKLGELVRFQVKGASSVIRFVFISHQH